MRHIKRIAFMLLGIAFATAPAIGTAYSIIAHGNSTIGAYIGMTLLSILTTGMMCILGGLIGKLIQARNINSRQRMTYKQYVI